MLKRTEPTRTRTRTRIRATRTRQGLDLQGQGQGQGLDHKDKVKDLTYKDSKQKEDKHNTRFLKLCH